MIKLVRVRDDRLPDALHGVKRVQREYELARMRRGFLANGSEGSPAWKSDYWKDGKEVLKAESSGKCAYCETPFSAGGHGDVEHFRPKSTYWWLAYCYDNHCYSCQICNQSFKGDKFPIQGGTMKGPNVKASTSDASLDKLAGVLAPDPRKITAGYTLSKFVGTCKQEKPGLLDPYIDDATEHFAWKVDPVNREVTLVAARATPRTKYVIRCAEECLGLNRETLKRRRYEIWEIADAFRTILTSQDVPATAKQVARNTLDSMRKPDQPYAGMLSYFAGQWGL